MRRHDDAVGAMRVLPRERGVVAPDFRARPLRVREEVEIVNRHDLCGRFRRQEQRVK